MGAMLIPIDGCGHPLTAGGVLARTAALDIDEQSVTAYVVCLLCGKTEAVA